MVVSTVPTESSVPYRQKPGGLNSHGRILRFLDQLPRDVSILDLGIATGYLGQTLRRLGFQSVHGIEANAEWAAHARPFYESVAVCDLERDPLPWDRGAFEVIICADVLEHLREPQAALQKLKSLLAPRGWLIVSLPNIAHWTIRLSLLLGRFRYTANGILDAGHLRFFTRATARTLLQEAGLTIRQEAATPLPIAHWCTNGSLWSPLWRAVERVDWGLGCLRPTLFAYQFVFITQHDGQRP